MTRRPSQIIEDPSISRVARIEAVRVWQMIEDNLVAARWMDFFHERTVALASEIPKIAKTYGKETARMVEHAIMTRDSTTLGPRYWRRITLWLVRMAIVRHGRLRRRDRWAFKLTGYSF